MGRCKLDRLCSPRDPIWGFSFILRIRSYCPGPNDPPIEKEIFLGCLQYSIDPKIKEGKQLVLEKDKYEEGKKKDCRDSL